MDIETFRSICLAMPGVTEHMPFGDEVLVFKVGDKMFALTDINTFASVNLKCDPGLALELRDRYASVKPGYHMNKTHWNTIDINSDMDDKELLTWLRHSYDLVLNSLPAKTRNAINPS